MVRSKTKLKTKKISFQKSIVPFLDVLSKVIGGDLKSDNELLGQIAETSSDDVSSQSSSKLNTKNDETIIDQQSSLWGASSGIEWQGKCDNINSDPPFSYLCLLTQSLIFLSYLRNGQVISRDRIPNLIIQHHTQSPYYTLLKNLFSIFY